jgi:enoyl-CoA hydratase/carnithine racemase
MDQTLLHRPVRPLRSPEAYFGRCASLRLARTWDGVLVARLATDAGALTLAPQACDGLAAAFRRIGRDARNKVVVLTGAGGDFIAGGDCGDPDGMAAMLRSLAGLAAPLIAAVEGRAHGLPEIVLGADVIVAGKDARFQRSARQLPADREAVRGLWRRRIGALRADAFLACPAPLSASRAAAWGLVDEVTATGAALARAMELARAYLAVSERLRRRLRAEAAQQMIDALAPTEPLVEPADLAA